MPAENLPPLARPADDRTPEVLPGSIAERLAGPGVEDAALPQPVTTEPAVLPAPAPALGSGTPGPVVPPAAPVPPAPPPVLPGTDVAPPVDSSPPVAGGETPVESDGTPVPPAGKPPVPVDSGGTPTEPDPSADEPPAGSDGSADEAEDVTEPEKPEAPAEEPERDDQPVSGSAPGEQAETMAAPEPKADGWQVDPYQLRAFGDAVTRARSFLDAVQAKVDRMQGAELTPQIGSSPVGKQLAKKFDDRLNSENGLRAMLAEAMKRMEDLVTSAEKAAQSYEEMEDTGTHTYGNVEVKQG